MNWNEAAKSKALDELREVYRVDEYRAWNATKTRALDELRQAYEAEIERFAESLRVRFESGELHAERDGDPHDGEIGPLHNRTCSSPGCKLEELVTAHFGLGFEVIEVPKERCTMFTGDSATAYAILAVSHFAEEDSDAYHIVQPAQVAATRDVLAIARGRRWYTPTTDEGMQADESVEVTAAEVRP